MGGNVPGKTRRGRGDMQRGVAAPDERIVVGYDGSKHARHALESAATIAGERATVIIVSVAPYSHGSTPAPLLLSEVIHAGTYPAGPLTTSLSVAAEYGKEAEIVDPKAEEYRAAGEEAQALLTYRGIRAEIRIATGDAASAIIQVAREIGADLIVVGTRGRNPASASYWGR